MPVLKPRLLRFLLIFIPFMGVAVCSSDPQYRTRAVYEAPTSREGQMCLNQCDSLVMQCKSRAQEDLNACERDLERRDAACLDEAAEQRDYCIRNNSVGCDLSYSNTLSSCRMNLPTCQLDTSSCDQTYNTCFERCGGNIRFESVCVRNCDKQ